MAKGYLIGEGITLKPQYDVGIALLAVTRRLVQRTYEWIILQLVAQKTNISIIPKVHTAAAVPVKDLPLAKYLP